MAPELIYSPLCRKLTRDGIGIEIQIYRDEQDPEWHLEVVEDQEGGSTVWDDTFPTDQEALDEALRTIEVDGITTFLRARDQKLN